MTLTDAQHEAYLRHRHDGLSWSVWELTDGTYTVGRYAVPNRVRRMGGFVQDNAWYVEAEGTGEPIR